MTTTRFLHRSKQAGKEQRVELQSLLLNVRGSQKEVLVSSTSNTAYKRTRFSCLSTSFVICVSNSKTFQMPGI